MVVKLNNGAVREIKKAEPIVEKRFTFNGDTLRMVAKANSSKEAYPEFSAPHYTEDFRPIQHLHLLQIPIYHHLCHLLT